MKILMVCLGNICRSPLAEGILDHKARQQGLPWRVDSAGTGSWHIGQGPDPRSVATAKAHGIDITGQRARQLKRVDLEKFDLVLAMDGQNYRDILSLSEDEDDRNKVHMIMEFAYPGKRESVPDPYWDDNGFERVFEMLDSACDAIVNKLSKADQGG
ncbi:MAG: low molecular weight phosphotyrosine protein phosphatase [Lewinellaceae bacterium]|nr:low molecular weight phosphotyrosine protein phosphatase [Lewinellaceae bacterium]